ncbi:hypothetical protein G9A89_012686 [Geosiphon pyriformis]|nr:hypothetical protein G9A89_012686 [Geosiphon pyriformis]
MDAVYFKVEHLKSLWNEYRVANESFGKDYSNQSQWAREKLHTVLTEFDKLIQAQVLWKSSLSAEIEDLLIEIEEQCHLFGRQVENVIGQSAGPILPTNTTTREYLQSIRDSLQEEIEVTRTNINTWVDGVTLFIQELGIDDNIPPKEIFETDLSSSVVQPVWCKYDKLIRIVTRRRDLFEGITAQLHFYFNALNRSPQDDIDRALAKLFLDKKTPKDISELLQQIKDNEAINNNTETINSHSHSDSNRNVDCDDYNDDDDDDDDSITTVVGTEKPPREYIYYRPQLPAGLDLSEEQLSTLKEKLIVLEKDYVERKDRRDKLEKIVKNLWEELNMPVNERQIKLHDSLEEEYLQQLSLEQERLRAIMREIIQKAIDEYTVQLGELWDKCLVPQNERDDFFASFQDSLSAEEVYERLAQEVDRLKELYAKCARIYKLMLERRALIEKMIEFEKKASDPRRLFQSSFRLLEEEKWRKSCWPSLVRIEDQLIKACLEYEENERKPFMHESVRYLDTLQNEIGERIVNQMFFGFEQNPTKGLTKLEKETLEAAQLAKKRRDSAASNTSTGGGGGTGRNKSMASRPVSPSLSVVLSRPGSPVSRSSTNNQKTPMYLSNNANGLVETVPKNRPVGIRASNKGNEPVTRSRPASRAVSPTKAGNRRTSMYLGTNDFASKSRSVSPSKAPSRRTSMYLNQNGTSQEVNFGRGRPSSRSVSPSPSSSNNISPASRPGFNTARRRSSLYLDSNTVVVIEEEKQQQQQPNKTSQDQPTQLRRKLPNSQPELLPHRSNSVSSDSSTTSSSSVVTPSTPEPHIVNGRLAVSSNKSKLSTSTNDKSEILQSPTKDNNEAEKAPNNTTGNIKLIDNKLNGKSTRGIPRPKTPLRSATTSITITPNSQTSALTPQMSIRRASSTNGLRTRPSSIVGGISNGFDSVPTPMLKKEVNKKMSLIVEGGR